MSKKCNSCGADLADDVMFCDKCGAKQEMVSNAAPTSTAVPAEDNNVKSGMSKNAIVALAACAVVAIVVIVLLCSALFGGGYKKVIKAQVKAYNKDDAEYITKTMPEDLLDAYDDMYKNNDDIDDYKDAIDESIERRKESIEESDEPEIGENSKLSCKIIDKIKLTEKECKSISKTIKTVAGKKLDVTAGYSVLTKVKVKGDDGEYETFNTCVAAKVDGKWTLISGNLFGDDLIGISSLMTSDIDY